MLRNALALTLATVAFCGTAMADIEWPSVYDSTSAGGSAFAAGGPPSGSLNAVDGTTAGYQLTSNAVYTLTFTVDFNGTLGHNPAGDPGVLLYGFNFSPSYTVSLTGLQWSNSGNGHVSNAFNPALSLATGDTVKIDKQNFALNTLTSFDEINRLTITFSVNTNGVTGQFFLFDAVSNPEPGTMALFGLGAMGLGGLAWRRRKNAKKASAKA